MNAEAWRQLVTSVRVDRNRLIGRCSSNLGGALIRLRRLVFRKTRTSTLCGDHVRANPNATEILSSYVPGDERRTASTSKWVSNTRAGPRRTGGETRSRATAGGKLTRVRCGYRGSLSAGQRTTRSFGSSASPGDVDESSGAIILPLQQRARTGHRRTARPALP